MKNTKIPRFDYGILRLPNVCHKCGEEPNFISFQGSRVLASDLPPPEIECDAGLVECFDELCHGQRSKLLGFVGEENRLGARSLLDSGESGKSVHDGCSKQYNVCKYPWTDILAVVDGNLGALPAVSLNGVKELKDQQLNKFQKLGTLSFTGILWMASLSPMEGDEGLNVIITSLLQYLCGIRGVFRQLSMVNVACLDRDVDVRVQCHLTTGSWSGMCEVEWHQRRLAHLQN